ncbi:MAG TPA: bifunctional precorrin-2 dehydrogenase/sirohydrochlorin ferrochelatase [Acidimicrobiia bacterium]|nr:bifunctional precorrin-2 dehydrogenase/sirohydrochlorin ferrochelatase [Acidimicrobiia bacterium]
MTTTRRSLLGYPVNLVVAGRRCVVVGAGRIAARKVDGLLAAGAEVHVVAPRFGDRVRAWRDEGRITVAERAFRAGDLDGAWLATAATDDHAVNHAVYAAGDARGVWVNSADDPDNCSFTLMSVIRRGDLVVTVGTGGRSPALATWLKERITAELGPEYETLVELLSDARDAMQADGRSTEEADWKRALDSGMLDLIRAGRVDDAKELLRSCLSSSSV